ncbi:MAG TPA: glycosyltransferase 87 family protein, partial [Bryobacteraceae bacterium]|nr:glycosyltransferase 87 family protein [Bryobacteraceae bacterium]
MVQRVLWWIAAIAAIAFLLVPPLVHGWTHVETDFPNYHTAARMFLHRVPLRDLYDWTSFQRQMNYAGWGLQLGGYIPHTPLTALPMVPFAWLPPMTAKRVWLSLSLIFLAAAIWILAKLTNLPVPGLIVLALLGYNAMSGNFELGQYYCFLLFLMTAAVWLLLREREFPAGLLLGAIFILKLYAGPFLFYFAWKRRWRALSGMLLACLILSAFSVAWFGWRDHLFYLTDVLPRAAAGEHMDPYNPGMPTILNMLRHPLEAEAELNPNPPFNNPALLFFLQPLLTLAIPAFCLLAIPSTSGARVRLADELAWFLIMLVLVSPSRAFYVTIILLLPIALLLEKASLPRRIFLIAAYLLLNISLPAAIEPYFPTVWILFALYIALGIPFWRNMRPAFAALAAIGVLAAAAFSSHRRMDSYYREPPQKFERIAFEKEAIYSASPAVSTDGIIYESIAESRYLLKRWNGSAIDAFPFDGQAFHPSVDADGKPIYFELVSDGHSQLMSYDPETKALRRLVSAGFEPTHPAVSPKGDVLAFVARGILSVYSFGSIGAIDGPRPVHDAAWFPSGAKLAYSAGPWGDAQIFATVSPKESERLTHDSGDHTEPAVSLDGTWLAYTLARGGTRQVWIQNLITRKSTAITEGACNSYSPAWEPDSRALIFACDCQRGIGL